MLKINELVASGESLSIKRSAKRRSSFYESTSIVVGDKILKTRWDAYQLTKIISGESNKFGDKVKKLFNDTVTWIKKVCKWIWRKIKKIGRFFKYLFTGKIKDFKTDEAWQEAAEKMADAVEDAFKEMNTKEFQSKVAKEMGDLYNDVINEMEDTTTTMRDKSKSYKEQAKSMDDFLNNMSKATEDITDYVEKKEREVVIDEVVEAEILSASQMASSMQKATKNIGSTVSNMADAIRKNRDIIFDRMDKRQEEADKSERNFNEEWKRNREEARKSSDEFNKKFDEKLKEHDRDTDKMIKELNDILDQL